MKALVAIALAAFSVFCLVISSSGLSYMWGLVNYLCL